MPQRLLRNTTIINDMAKPVAIIGGFLVIIGVVGGLFLEFFGWFNYDLILSEGVINSFGGTGGSIFGFEQDNTYFSEEIIELLPGIIAAVGGLLMITQNKTMCIIGGVLVLLGIGPFLINLLGNESLMDAIENIDGNIFYYKDEFFGIEYWVRMGYGVYVTLAGGILGTLGGVTGKN